jgi:hypothetical protein
MWRKLVIGAFVLAMAAILVAAMFFLFDPMAFLPKSAP